MKKILFNALALLPTALFVVASLSGCSNEQSGSEKLILRVLSSADYIYEEDSIDAYDTDCNYTSAYLLDEEGNPKANMMDQFVAYMADTYNIEVSYVYDTFDTNETMYNELMTGKSSYDIICTSDYMVQKLISTDLIQPISTENYTESDELKNIHNNISSYLWDIFDGIHPKDKNTNEPIKDKIVSSYSVPYMWGTVGVMYNPAFYSNLETDSVIELFKSWDALYSEDTKNSFSIKDSVRDVYAVSIVHALYQDEIKPLEEKLASNQITKAEFNVELNKIFNRCDSDTLTLIKEDILALKSNSFGFEVDSGKTDMIEGKIGANLAWSGDATWAIEQAESDYGKELYFSIPKEGSNIWIDGFCIPTSSTQKDLATKFIDFMSQPTQAIENMWCVGYTSATAGIDTLNYIYENYDIRGAVGGEILEDYVDYEAGTYDLSYFFGNSIDNPADAVLNPIPGVVGRTLTAQFPEQGELSHLCVMDDFGTQNEAVLDMWEHVRTNALPIWAIIILLIELLAALTFFIYTIIRKVSKKRLKKVRRDERLLN